MGGIEQVLVKGKNGYMLAIPASRDVILAVLVKRNAELESAFSAMKRIVDILDREQRVSPLYAIHLLIPHLNRQGRDNGAPEPSSFESIVNCAG